MNESTNKCSVITTLSFVYAGGILWRHLPFHTGHHTERWDACDQRIHLKDRITQIRKCSMFSSIHSIHRPYVYKGTNQPITHCPTREVLHIYVLIYNGKYREHCNATLQWGMLSTTKLKSSWTQFHQPGLLSFWPAKLFIHCQPHNTVVGCPIVSINAASFRSFNEVTNPLSLAANLLIVLHAYCHP